ncbi:cue4p [Saccharomyces arboricola H-6]|uniref:Cue4p n=1 Tax=Saccharomyces arboricola (strain H-6 / AS 2.3317 / CBS 10644) TaxID=1160507 RepID=J8PK55_SACAR|nr:cue4p [Saccharomyces arboricola H-6]
MDGSTVAFILTMVCMFVYTIKRRNTKQAPTRTVHDTTPAATTATQEPEPASAPVSEQEQEQEQRVNRSAAHRVNHKRPVNNDMVEIVMTMAPHISSQKIMDDLRDTGSIESTMENIFAGKLD